MTDGPFGDDSGFDEFDGGFFASLEASPDDPADDAGPGAEERFTEDGPADDVAPVDVADDGAFLYEAEGDGSFETDATGLDEYGADAFDIESDAGSGADGADPFDPDAA